MNELKYSAKQIQGIIKCLDQLEIKGLRNHELISGILGILENPLTEPDSDRENAQTEYKLCNDKQ